jgi:molybdenum cofactor cytidylyltransferase
MPDCCKLNDHLQVSAVVLAAGLSTRMGRPKMTLPWGKTTVIQSVISILEESQIGDILVVTGGAREEVEKALKGSRARTVFNPDFQFQEMLSSLKVGLKNLTPHRTAALVVLGDQPQIERKVVREILAFYQNTGADLIVPSYRMHRGHPWLVSRPLWVQIHELSSDQTLRDFLNQQAEKISYLNVDTPSVLKDLDTPEDWQRDHPD